MGTKYLTGKRLAKCIRLVMAGDEPKMCVAFLGPNWAEELFDDGAPPKELRVVCDLRMGMTVRAALCVGGAPNNDRLRHLPNREMHAKVYASATGAVICSANASHAALSSGKRIEDGVWLPPGGKAYCKAASTFDERFGKAVPVDADALARAPEYLEASGATIVDRGQPHRFAPPTTILQLLRQEAKAFKGIWFVFSKENVSRAVQEGAKAAMDVEEQVNGNATRDGDARQPRYDYFADWDLKESVWPALFISVHQSSDGDINLGMRRHLRFILDVSDGKGGTEDVFVAAKVRWNIGGGAFGDLRRLDTVSRCEAELAEWFQNGSSFDNVAGQALDAVGARKALALS
ncbi:MAG TPA: hypothetical protein ENH56_13885 [Roseobacter sp.]|uniref:Uncharacterized protein n=1 Tax=marine sediment metagenome TaxID=412755 RepID=A0A0F9S204_9ZZZZ|nr:hypothetical protein [Roseobacter sp.]